MSDVDGASSFDALAQQLTRLHAVVESRRGGDFTSSYTAGLIADPRRAAKKMGEEAVETVIAAAMGDLEAVAAESADLLYHLLALWAAVGLSPTVWPLRSRPARERRGWRKRRRGGDSAGGHQQVRLDAAFGIGTGLAVGGRLPLTEETGASTRR